MTPPTDGVVVYEGPAVSTIEEAIERLDEIDAYIDAREPRKSSDGVACFNHLYGIITRRVLEGVNDGFFEDGEFLTVLDVAFANRYLDALRSGVQQPSNVPRSWRVLVERRSDDRLESIQFAVAGVNAHINLDLAVALVQTCEQIGKDIGDGTQRSDYEKVNQIFAEEMTTLRQHYEEELARSLDNLASPVLDVIGNWSVDAARDAAWEVAEQLLFLQGFGINKKPFVDRLDRLTSLAGHFLLTPIN